MAVVREDVVKITYDVPQNPFADVNKDINKMTSGAESATAKVADVGKIIANVGKNTANLSSVSKSVFGGIQKAASSVTQKITSLIGKFGNLKGALANLPSAALTKLGTLMQSLGKSAMKAVIDGLKKIKQGLANLPSAALNKITSGLKKMKQGLAKLPSTALDKITSGFKKMGAAALDASKKIASVTSKVLLGGLAAAGAGITALTTKAVNAFADMEQNVGGAEVVFKDLGESINDITANITALDPQTGKLTDTTKSLALISADAYKTMGISQSEYLASANKMASLFQGSGLSQQRSLDLTTQAMQRAADVASIMGIDQAAALESVTGAAKGNYTMMDNLGVAMNNTTLEAYRVSKGMKTAFDKMNNAQKAELAMQYFFERTNQYAGNFEREATETISGSFGLLKASTQSLIAGLGDSEADISHLTKNVTDAGKAVVKNVTPIVKNVLKALPEVISTAKDELSANLPEIQNAVTGFIKASAPGVIGAVKAIVPKVFSTVGSLITTYGPQIAQTAVTLVPQVISKVAEVIQTNLPRVIDTAKQVVQQIASGIGATIGQLTAVGNQLIGQVISGITPYIPTVIQYGVQAGLSFLAGVTENLPAILSGGIRIIQSAIDGIVQSLPMVAEQGPKIISNLVSSVVGALPELGSAILSGIVGILENLPSLLVGAIKGIGGGVLDGIKSWFIGSEDTATAAGTDAANSLAKGISSQTGAVTQAAANLSQAAASSFKVDVAADAFKIDTASVMENTSTLAKDFSAGIQSQQSVFDEAMSTSAQTAGTAFSTGFKSKISEMTAAAREATNSTKAVFDGIDLNAAGTQAGRGFAQGLASQKPAILAQANDIANSVSGTINTALKIHSPSRVAFESAQFFDMGLVKGLESMRNKVGSAAERVATMMHSSVLNTAGSAIRGTNEPIRGTAERSLSNGRRQSVTNHFAPSFTLNMNGASATDANQRKVRKWIRDGINDTFNQLSRQTSYQMG